MTHAANTYGAGLYGSGRYGIGPPKVGGVILVGPTLAVAVARTPPASPIAGMRVEGTL